ncbi:tyrosine-type recombinase/integrase [Vibrio parahaemolyticus]|uniref:tyrosine-type recombinase/integrase n=1 Tax=Vibrio parahaemolyticus TaxID=670 RepID=UPI00235F47BC|nr:tyrosine-type recombinase/integrase [Vibrio parahaemolyticus]MDL2013379.1 tyrosine-type recombinase/integrase [Vibrio parahaemolyticus]HCG6790328.1 tyrosine-type recombinase/integrase [Vibrio parahaemolyticus]HCH3852162.1 tyrosine-type recombinase/integrase [Vibrio parahaemolyticus]HCM1417200.1 tyrosine-type recombinase/integrase [Vibrio parahaemolyticus]
MARRTTSLTNTQIKQAKAKEKEYALSDGDGLSLRIRPSGSKTWIFNYYTPYTKKRSKISFGTFPDVSLAYARQQREEARVLVAQGIDPKYNREEREQARRTEIENTFEAFSLQYLDIKSKTAVASTIKKRKETLNNYLLPAIGGMSVTDVKPAVLKRLLDPVYADGKVETVKRICIVANEIMRIAVTSGAIEFNPISDITKLYPAKKTNHNPHLAPEELPELVEALAKANITLTTRNLILWQLHTITRPGETAAAKWSQIDFDEKVWVVPVPKMHKTHTVPLTPQMLAILDEMRLFSGHREYIFPADRDPKRHTNQQTANAALKRIGFKDRSTAHGLRGLASTTLNEHGFDGDLVESALSHEEENKVRRAYNHTDYLERRIPMMHWWSERIEQAGKGEMLKVTVRGLRIA